MITLKNIMHKGDTITCDAFPEDCKQPVTVSFRVSTKDTERCDLPEDYKWCIKHIAKAKWYLLGLLEKGEELPKETKLMWV